MMKRRQQKKIWKTITKPRFTRIIPTLVKDERRSLRARIDLFNKPKIPYSSTNYMFIAKVSGFEMRHRNDKYIAEQSTPQVNNAKLTKTNSTLYKKILFKDAVALWPHSLFRILSHRIATDSTSNGSNSTSRKCNSNRTFKRFLITLSITKNNNNTITVGKAVNALMKVIHGIEGYANKVKIAPWKSKQPNQEFMKYIKGVKYPEA